MTTGDSMVAYTSNPTTWKVELGESFQTMFETK